MLYYVRLYYTTICTDFVSVLYSFRICFVCFSYFDVFLQSLALCGPSARHSGSGHDVVQDGDTNPPVRIKTIPEELV